MTAAGDFNPTRFIAGFQRITAAADMVPTFLRRMRRAVCSKAFALKTCETAMNKSIMEASKITL